LARLVVRPLVTGEFGQVFEVEHETSGRRGACQVKPAPTCGSDLVLQKFLRSAFLLASVDHPNLPAVRRTLGANSTPAAPLG